MSFDRKQVDREINHTELGNRELKFELDNISGKDLVAINLGKLTLWSAKVIKTKSFIITCVIVFLFYVSNIYFMVTDRIVEVPGEFVKASEFSNLPKKGDTVNALSVRYVRVNNLFQQLNLWFRFGKYNAYISDVSPDTVLAASKLYTGSDMLNMQLSAFLAVHNMIGDRMDYASDVRITAVPAVDGVNPTLLPNDVILKLDGLSVKESRDVELAQLQNRYHILIISRNGVEMTFTSNLLGVEYGKTLYLKNQQDYQSFYNFARLSLQGYRGTSAGSALAVDYYNHSVENVTKGRKIAMTGTINDTGRVGQIGGVKAKTILAIENNVDIMFVPSDIPEARNYSDALEVVNGLHAKMKLVVANNLSDIIDYLKQ